MYVPVLHDEERIERANRVISSTLVCDSECLALAWNGRSWKARRRPWNALLKGDQELCLWSLWVNHWLQTEDTQPWLQVCDRNPLDRFWISPFVSGNASLWQLGRPRESLRCFQPWSFQGSHGRLVTTVSVEEEYQIWRRSSPRAGNMVLVGTEEQKDPPDGPGLW